MVLLLISAVSAQDVAADAGPSLMPADPNEEGDTAFGAFAAAVLAHGPIPFSRADVMAKAAANRAYDALDRAGAISHARGPVGGTGPAAVLLDKPGLSALAGSPSPPDSSGAIGPTRFIQLVNRQAGIFDPATGALIGSGTMNQLAGVAASVTSSDPQVIWDATTDRFYYAMILIYSAADNRLAFGFSKTASPGNVTSGWCHYTLPFGRRLPDFPRLGDSQFFVIIGVNGVDLPGNFLGADLIAISKPASGTLCPARNRFKIGKKLNLVDSGGLKVFTPVPANEIDTWDTGFVVARNGDLPSGTLWMFRVTRNPANELPAFGSASALGAVLYDSPPDAPQPIFSQKLDTLDARPTQAVGAIDPSSVVPGGFAIWTQHTIKPSNSPASIVLWYEYVCVPTKCQLHLLNGVGPSQGFTFNGAISPDRRVDGPVSEFGDKFVIEYSFSDTPINPGIGATSGGFGGPGTVVQAGVGPYRDFTCRKAGSTCSWGDYSSASPDPRPGLDGHGVVWGTNQFSGVSSPYANRANWQTRIFEFQP
jgi:hypothetical protein